MNPDYVEHVFLNFDTVLVWGERDKSKFERRLTGAHAERVHSMMAKHQREISALLFKLAGL